MKTNENDSAAPIFFGFIIGSIGCGLVWGLPGLGWGAISTGAFYIIIGILGAISEAFMKKGEKP